MTIDLDAIRKTAEDAKGSSNFVLMSPSTTLEMVEHIRDLRRQLAEVDAVIAAPFVGATGEAIAASSAITGAALARHRARMKEEG